MKVNDGLVAADAAISLKPRRAQAQRTAATSTLLIGAPVISCIAGSDGTG